MESLLLDSWSSRYLLVRPTPSLETSLETAPGYHLRGRLGVWDTTSVTRAECNVGVWVVLKLSHAQLPRLNVCLAPAQLVPRLDQGSATIAPLIFRTIRITDVLNAFLIMSVNRIITPNRQGQTIANSVSQRRDSATENVELEGTDIARKLTVGRRICALMLTTPAGGATSAMDLDQNLVSSTRTFATRGGPL